VLVAAAVLGFSGLGYAAGSAGAGHASTSTASASAPSVAAPDAVTDPFGGTTSPDMPGGTFGRPSTSTEATPATDAQQSGVVLITSTTTDGEGAGTGMVLTSDGLVLTNHHVVEGATEVSVEVAATGRTYEAEVLGHDDEADVAVLRLEDASGLATVTTDTDEAVQVGDAVVGVGNAGGTGEATAAAGTVTATDRTIDVGDEATGTTSTLSGLIEVDADIVAGDSGGPLYDDDGEVVGMDTAASTGSADVTGYAVPVATALEVVDQVLAGDESGGVSVGPDAFLGVQLQDTGAGAVVVGTVDGSAAQAAGIEAGSTVTAVDGTRVDGADALGTAIDAHEPGDSVRLSWTDPTGTSHQASVTLREGPVG
jgi:S1-C subfamily serine protease